jgi:hypothetical protein
MLPQLQRNLLLQVVNLTAEAELSLLFLRLLLCRLVSLLMLRVARQVATGQVFTFNWCNHAYPSY